MQTCPCDEDTLIPNFYIVKLEFTGVCIIFLFCSKTLIVGTHQKFFIFTAFKNHCLLQRCVCVMSLIYYLAFRKLRTSFLLGPCLRIHAFDLAFDPSQKPCDSFGRYFRPTNTQKSDKLQFSFFLMFRNRRNKFQDS